MLERLRKPEYTGENRCWPCTVLNTILLLLACAVIAVFPKTRSRRLGLASIVGLVGGSAIALRGYFIPGTPHVAPRLAERLGFESHQSNRQPTEAGSLAGDSNEVSGERAMETLLDSGVIHAVGETLHLDENFRADWRQEMEHARDSDLEKHVRKVAPDKAVVEVIENGDWVVVSAGGPETEQWLSRPVAIAEVAGVRALADYGIDRDVRTQSASALRAFLYDCPDCDERLEETTASRCCGSGTGTSPLSPPDEVLACPACRQHVFTF
ncbi:hypothetical protein SAMN05421858_1829 [Haladaptatus litoreus]|uniref:Uncharacterized protein n=1 Tax=Haladaptatus litoreus TaxID=553468 RepID=A0A1N6Z1N1_9EURY|nr:hypothetical protein [Haladaptatus litoreus]SIR20758.1 hypothetical protein SAMN05421858_1829 [Haladaptatus litoreus]